MAVKSPSKQVRKTSVKTRSLLKALPDAILAIENNRALEVANKQGVTLGATFKAAQQKPNNAMPAAEVSNS